MEYKSGKLYQRNIASHSSGPPASASLTHWPPWATSTLVMVLVIESLGWPGPYPVII